MHILQFKQAGKRCIGVRIDENTAANLTEFSPDLPADVCSALASDHQKLLSEATRCLQSGGARVSLSDVELMPPLTNPDKIVCIGLNYRDHCEEVGLKPPTEPVVFSKFSSCISQSGDIPIPKVTKCIDYEVELVVVIAKKGKDIPEDEAMDYAFGYVAANDVSARDMVSFGPSARNGGQFLTAKALDQFCPLSSDLVTKDEIADVHNLSLSTTVNGEVKQSSNTGQLVFNVPQLISYVSSLFTLLPGDIILTGTPGGVGMGRKPPAYVNSGDVVEVTVEGVGKVTNKFV